MKPIQKITLNYFILINQLTISSLIEDGHNVLLNMRTVEPTLKATLYKDHRRVNVSTILSQFVFIRVI